MSDKDQRRAEIVGRLAAGALSVGEAAQLLAKSERHVRRLRQRYEADGLASVAHANSGRSPTNKTDPGMIARIVALAGKEGVYCDFNTTHLQQMLCEREDIQIGRSTLDRLLVAQGVRKRSRSRPRRSYCRRERRSHKGELLLIDGSPHAWLESRGPRMCLMAAIDDASSDVVHLRFWPTESLAGYLTLAQEIVTSLGLPESFYHDKHTILVSPMELTIADELDGKVARSQFQETLARLGVEGIKAHSPQAKGRIERLFRTLQDRLIKEMRLEGVATMEEANAFLPGFIKRYNSRFSVEPKSAECAWVVPDAALDLPYYFAARETRQVREDHTLAWLGATLQIERKKADPSLAGKSVQVHTDPSGQVFVYQGKERLEYKILAKQSGRPAAQKTAEAARSPEERKAARRRQMAHLYAGAGA